MSSSRRFSVPPCRISDPFGTLCVPNSSRIRRDQDFPARSIQTRVAVSAFSCEPPVEFDVQRSRRPALPLSVGDSVPVADNPDIPGVNIAQPGSASGAGTLKQGPDRGPFPVDVLRLRQAQRGPQPLRVIPVIEQILCRWIAARAGAEGRRCRIDDFDDLDVIE